MSGIQVNQLLTNNRVIIFAGSGGVGKTTTAAALAAHGAQLGKRVVVITIDPAKRLADALGVGGTAERRHTSLADTWIANGQLAHQTWDSAGLQGVFLGNCQKSYAEAVSNPDQHQTLTVDELWLEFDLNSLGKDTGGNFHSYSLGFVAENS